ncbi:MAG TPA: condensation domain-containing protein, partial [Candidatus Sulfotelmatobacter sp.]|nr:condensation domain-containing protein [Candidatus Sulfotelmatobacter sp.]
LRIKGIPASVRVANLAGEPLAAALVDQIYAESPIEKVYDLYGPTETTTYSTFALRKPGAPATIGRPLDNEQVYLLDSHLQPVPIGIPGELYIGGAGLAREYLNRPDLTAERFIDHPFIAGARLYKTGDLARWRVDGNLEFLGRIDHQVKIRGFRIELGEIEAALKKHPAVHEAVVVAREDPSGDKRLMAYVVQNPGHSLTVADLRQGMRERLPEYMVPSLVVFLEALPMTPSGKIDRKALPAPEPERQRTGTEFVAARKPIEEQLAAIWSEVLQLKQVGVLDNFFDLGGHSLHAIQVISRVREVFKVELPLFSLFDAPTIAALAQGLESGQWNQHRPPVLPLQAVSRAGSLPVSFVQERLWFIDQLEPGSHAYNVPAALRLKGRLEAASLQRAFTELMRRHEVLRTSFQYAEGELSQVITPNLPLEIQVADFGSVSAGSREQRVQEWVNATAQQPFDLARGPLIRASLARLAEAEHALVVVMHHTISDGWSQALLLQELAALYNAFAAGKGAPAFPALPVQYADFAHWQRQVMQGAVLEQELAYWKQRLAGAPAMLDLPTDRNEPE